MRSFLSDVFRNFILLIIFFLPLTFFGSIQKKITVFLFGKISLIIANTFNKPFVRIDFSSDSLSMYLLIAFLFILAIGLSFFRFQKKYAQIIESIFPVYLALILFKYGFDKVFKAQFYLPEPNILFTRFGDLDKDILFWSTIGTSYSYSLILGFIEIGVALLLLISRTKKIGAIFSVFLFLQIVLINFSFDISVKLFSCVLLLISIFISRNSWKKLFYVLLDHPTNNFSNIWMQRFALSLKTFFIILVLWICFEPVFNHKQINDDLFDRPLLHGAYKNMNDSEAIKYVFFHRKEYLIFMDKDENKTDFKYQLSENQLFLENNKGEITTLNYTFSKSDSIIILKNSSFEIRAKSIDWRKSNALQPLFHIMIEDVN